MSTVRHNLLTLEDSELVNHGAAFDRNNFSPSGNGGIESCRPDVMKFGMHADTRLFRVESFAQRGHGCLLGQGQYSWRRQYGHVAGAVRNRSVVISDNESDLGIVSRADH